MLCLVYHCQPNTGKLKMERKAIRMIQIENISVKKQGQFILQGVDWQTRPGEHWALLGANGAGKTTLLQVVLGYLWPTTGRVRVLGQNFGECDLRELRKRIGFVSVQMDVRLEGEATALELVASGKTASYRLYEPLTAKDRELAAHYLEEMGAGTLMDKPYQLLSQGERQKILIARALMANPELLVLDEPCNGLDFPSREQLLAAISGMTKVHQRQLIYVTHYPDEIVDGFTHAAILQKGRMAASGPLSEVLTDEVLSATYDVPVRVHWLEGRPVVRVQAG